MHTLATCKVLYHSMHTTVKAGTQGVGVALLVNNDKILYGAYYVGAYATMHTLVV